MKTSIINGSEVSRLSVAIQDMNSDCIPKAPEYQHARSYQGEDRNQYIAAQMKKIVEKAYEQERQEDVEDEFRIRRPGIMINQVESDAKYAEMSARHEGSIADVSSKFQLVDCLRRNVSHFDGSQIMPFDNYESHLLNKLTASEKMQLQNAFDKLKRKTPEEQIAYLRKGVEQRDTARGKYSSEIRSTFPHNEHLLVPDTKKDVIGIFVHPAQIDAALMLHQQYEQRFNVDLPFMSYDETTGKTSNLTHEDVRNMK